MRDGEKAMRVRAWVIGLAAMTTTVVGATEPLSIRVSPAMSFAPATLVIRTKVEPDADNRAMEVSADSEGFYRSSAIQLEGDRAPKTTTVEFRSLPSGEYEVTAVVIGADGRRKAVARAHVNVIESGSSH
jgi:streptogramin lyase